MNLSQLAFETTACARCSAAPGQPCLTRSGNRATDLHAARMAPIYDAWREGWKEGSTDQQEALEHLLGGLARTNGWVRAADVTAALARTRRWL